MIDSVYIKITDQNLIWTLMLIGKIFGDRTTYLTAVKNLLFENLMEGKWIMRRCSNCF